MSEPFANNAPAHPGAADSNDLLVDGDARRLGDAPNPTLAAPPLATPPEPTLAAPLLATPPAIAPATGAPALAGSSAPTPSDVPSLPVVSPVLASGAAPTLPAIVSPVEHAETDDAPAAANDDQAHPMAHLMPSKAIPNEASRRAAELRAAQKAKSKKIKIGVVSGALVFAAVVGPPLGKWLVDAINEAGDTSTEEPAE